MDEPIARESDKWFTISLPKGAPPAGWAGVGTPRALCYEGHEAGGVALVEWPDGRVTVLRREKDNSLSAMSISGECLDKIAELRGPLPGAELAT